jgi:hypothetical protein
MIELDTPKRIKHLEFIQATIVRLASNSFLLKGWTVTLVAALFALAAKETQHWFAIISESRQNNLSNISSREDHVIPLPVELLLLDREALHLLVRNLPTGRVTPVIQLGPNR